MESKSSTERHEATALEIDSSEPTRRSTGEDGLWHIIGSLIRWRRFIIGSTFLVGVAAIVISLLLPKWYKSTAKVMLPSSGGGGGLSAIIGNLDPAAASLLGGGGGDYIRYMAILTSRTMSESVIDEFDLVNVYGLGESATASQDAIEVLAGNTDFEVDREFDYLLVGVFDRDPQRATDMANFFVSELNRMNGALESESATQYREFVERRYRQAEAQLDTVRARLQRYQEEHGIVELDSQAEAFLGLMATYRARSVQAEIEYDALRRDFGSENPAVQSAKNMVAAAKVKERDLLAGRDALMPVAMPDLPEIARGYSEVMQEVLIQAKVIEFARPLLEQAILEEQRDTPAVQVLDEAKVPVHKARPKRMILVVATTFSWIILAVLFVLLFEWLRANRRYLSERLEAATRKP